MVEHPTLKTMMNEVVDYGSCCECSCVLVCPHNVIDYVDSKPKQVAKATAAFDFCGISEGIGCDVCAQVCPRLYPREFQLADVLFAADQSPHSGAFGRYRKIVAARSTDPAIQARGQDGGVVTGILAWGMRSGYIDGAVVSWTIVIPRTRKGEEVFDAMVAEGLLEVKPMEEFENSMKVLLRLARKQHQRVPVPPGREESFVRPAEFIGRVG
jgi:coenzyme F420-reducing hydrogenase beta subunit